MKCASYGNGHCIRRTVGSTSRLQANGRRKSKRLGGLSLNSGRLSNNKVKFAMFCLIHTALGYRYRRRYDKGENLTDEFFRPAVYRDFVARPSPEYAQALFEFMANRVDLIRLYQMFKRVTLFTLATGKPIRTYYHHYKDTPEILRESNARARKQLKFIATTFR